MDRDQLNKTVAEAQAQINMQAQQALAEKMTSLCIKRCITSPSDKLTDSTAKCLTNCTSSFLEGFGIAAETFASIAKRSATEK